MNDEMKTPTHDRCSAHERAGDDADARASGRTATRGTAIKGVATLLVVVVPVAMMVIAIASTRASSHGAAQAEPAEADHVEPAHAAASPDVEALASSLRAGLGSIASPGIPGTLAVWGENAAIVIADADEGVASPVMALVRLKRKSDDADGTLAAGMVVAFTHSGFADAGTLAHGDTGTLMARAVRAAAGKPTLAPDASAPQPLDGVRVAIAAGDDALAEWLGARGATVVRAAAGWSDHGAGAAWRNADVAIVGGTPDKDACAALVEWARGAGRGLVIAQTGWGWQQIHGGAHMDENPWNRALWLDGLAWTSEYATDTAEDGFAVAEPPTLAHGKRALSLLGAGEDEGAGREAARAHAARIAQASHAGTNAARFSRDPALHEWLDTMEASRGGPITPTPAAPVRRGDGLARVLIAYALARAERTLDPRQVSAHPAAATFPGSVPAEGPRIRREVAIRVDTDEWHSTGLYAAPGEVVTVTLSPRDRAGARLIGAGRVYMRIGCHTDTLWHLPQWRRMPSVASRVRLKEGQTQAASPFGGLVYIEVDAGRATAGEPIALDATIEGAVAAPYYVRGVTTPEQWRAVRDAAAPWAELATDKVIVSVPSSYVRTLDDPEALLAMWDEILDTAADLATIPRERARPERFVPDEQISAGYMHSGYPIMTHLDAATDMVTVASLRAGTWGLFHELGHNHQNADWTFDGTVEVTVNLFTLFIMERVSGKAPGTGHEALNDRAATIGKHVALGSPFDRWKREPFTALEMYIQLREAFGWEAYQRVFAEYLALDPRERPRTEEEKRDQWLMRMSRATGRNLGPFFEHWGVPTSAAAREAVRELPPWLPEGFPPTR